MVQKILIEKFVVCPVCGDTTALTYPNPKLYVVKGRESDHHVTGYTWLHGIKTDVLPHYYMVWQCPICFYADFKDAILDFKKTLKNSKLIESFQESKNKEVFNILKALRRFSIKGYSPEGSVARHLSAIYINLLPSEEQRDHHKIGRLYLRLAWLYRELVPRPDETAVPLKTKENREVIVGELGRGLEEMESSYMNLKENLRQIKGVIAKRLVEEGIKGGTGDDPYSVIINNLGDKIGGLRTAIELTRQTITRDREGVLSFEKKADQQGFKKMLQRLFDLVPLWAEMPLDEKISLQKSVAAFDQSLRLEGSDRNDDQEMSLINLILSIQMKIGDLKGALNYINQIYKIGFRDRQTLQQRISIGKQNKSMSDYDAKMIQKKIGKINALISRIGDKRKSVFKMIYAAEKSKIDGLIKKNTGRPQEEILAVFEREGLNQEMVPFLIEQGILPVHSKKRRK